MRRNPRPRTCPWPCWPPGFHPLRLGIRWKPQFTPTRFGVVSTHWPVSLPSISEPKDGGDPAELAKVDITRRLIDFGEDAKNEMPETT
jgi:hypothetical protein